MEVNRDLIGQTIVEIATFHIIEPRLLARLVTRLVSRVAARVVTRVVVISIAV